MSELQPLLYRTRDFIAQLPTSADEEGSSRSNSLILETDNELLRCLAAITHRFGLSTVLPMAFNASSFFGASGQPLPKSALSRSVSGSSSSHGRRSNNEIPRIAFVNVHDVNPVGRGGYSKVYRATYQPEGAEPK